MPALPKDMVAIAIKTGASTRAQVTTAPRYKAGDKIVARNINPPTHTRLPRYIRGKHGVVQHNHGGVRLPRNPAAPHAVAAIHSRQARRGAAQSRRLRLRRYARARARRPAAPRL